MLLAELRQRGPHVAGGRQRGPLLQLSETSKNSHLPGTHLARYHNVLVRIMVTGHCGMIGATVVERLRGFGT